MRRVTACALTLALGARGAVARADSALSTLLHVERERTGNVQLVLNEIHAYPIVAVCLGVEAGNVPLSTTLEHLAEERRGSWSSTRNVGGSVDCIELPSTEIAAGFWFVARRWDEIFSNGGRSSAAGSAATPQTVAMLSELRLGVLATEASEPGSGSNAAHVVVTVSGDFAPDAARTFAKVHLAEIPPADYAVRPQYRQTTERLSVLEDSALVAPLLQEAWLAPVEAAAIETAIAVLSTGNGSRIIGNVVEHRRLATDAMPLRFEHAGNWMVGFRVFVSLRTTVDKAQRFVDGAMKQLRFAGPSPAEVLRAKRLLMTRLMLEASDTRWRAERLTETELVRGNAELLASDFSAYDSVTAASVKDVAKRLLTDERRCIVEAYPSGYLQDDPALEGYELYTVQPADTWSTVSRRFELQAELIAHDNDLDLRHRLTPGQVLWVRPKKAANTSKRPH